MRYRLLGRSGLRVSELSLGTMTFGEEWGWGANKEESRRQLDLFAEAGGNFIDTANLYTGGASETMLGEFLQGDRDRWVLATKYTLNLHKGDPNGGGNHRKSMMRNVEESLKRLRTDYIDLYYVHMWDELTPVDEVMRGLDDLVRQGKVNYIGISDTPAWISANTMAELRGWSRFVALQIEYSLIERTVERDLVPMAAAHGLSVTAWSPLAQGLLAGKYKRNGGEADAKRMNPDDLANITERKWAIMEALDAVAADLGQPSAIVALAWLLHQPNGVIPILGARTADQFAQNLKCLDVQIPEEAMQKLNDASAIEPGFPHSFLQRDFIKGLWSGGTYDRIVR